MGTGRSNGCIPVVAVTKHGSKFCEVFYCKERGLDGHFETSS